MIGPVVAIFQYLQQLSKMFFNIAASFQEIVQIKTDFNSIKPINNAYAKIQKQEILKTQKIPETWRKIEIKNLSFSYDVNHKVVLENIHLTLLNNAKIALVGESGSGKSTLLNILRGLYKANIEDILVDNKHYSDLSILSHVTTLIPQEPEIFEHTIEYNIAVGAEVNEEEIQDFVKAACFDKVVKNLSDGLNTDIRERGVNLSGGEKQRLALARGLLAAKDSSIILLDEPTSSVDIQNETKIYENILLKYKNQCIISSIHRLHLLDKFDLIYVMEKGKIVQTGTLNDLKEQKGLFKDLWEKYIKQENELKLGENVV